VAQADGAAVAATTQSFRPGPAGGLISAIGGALPAEGLAAVKVVGTFPDNAARGLPNNPALMVLLDGCTGEVQALLDASYLTTLRTAAVSAIGIRALARPDAKVLGCIGTRGIAIETLRLVAPDLALDEIRLHGRDPATCAAAAMSLASELGVAVRPAPDWHACLEGADIMIEGASLAEPCALFPTEVVAPGATLVAYGAWSAFAPDLPGRIDRLVMDRWADGTAGALGPHVAAGAIGPGSIDSFIGDILAGRAEGRRTTGERILFWHRGVAACDIALAALMLDAARNGGRGHDRDTLLSP
jgi:ornithine cyclodeaminase